MDLYLSVVVRNPGRLEPLGRRHDQYARPLETVLQGRLTQEDDGYLAPDP